MAEMTDVTRNYYKKWDEAMGRIAREHPRVRYDANLAVATEVIFTEIRKQGDRIVEAIENYSQGIKTRH